MVRTTRIALFLFAVGLLGCDAEGSSDTDSGPGPMSMTDASTMNAPDGSSPPATDGGPPSTVDSGLPAETDGGGLPVVDGGPPATSDGGLGIPDAGFGIPDAGFGIPDAAGFGCTNDEECDDGEQCCSVGGFGTCLPAMIPCG